MPGYPVLPVLVGCLCLALCAFLSGPALLIGGVVAVVALIWWLSYARSRFQRVAVGKGGGGDG